MSDDRGADAGADAEADAAVVDPAPRRADTIRGGAARVGLWLFALSLCTYLFTGAGYVQTEDVTQALRVAVALVEHHDVHITGSPVVPWGGLVIGSDGRTYAAHGLGLSLLLLPAALLKGLVGAPAVPAVAAALDPLLGAAWVSAVYALALRLGSGVRGAAAAAVLFGFAGIAWPYAHFSFDAAATGLCLQLGVLGLLSTGRSPGRVLLAWTGSGAAFGFAVVLRVDAAVLLPVAAVLAIARARGSGGSVRRLALWSVPLAAMLALAGWYDWVRFGAVTDVGHAHDPFLRATTPILEGLYGLLASPGKGLFVYSPTLLLGAAGLVLLFRDRRLPALAIALMVALSAIAHARLAGWAGDEAWGPRFLVPVAGLLAAPAALVLDRWRSLRRATRGVVVALAAAGATIQLAGVGVAYLPLFHLPHAPKPDYFSLRGWPIGRHVSALLRSAAGGQPYPDRAHGGIVTPPVPRLDFWWARSAANGQHLGAAAVLVAVLVASGATAAFLLVRDLRIPPPVLVGGTVTAPRGPHLGGAWAAWLPAHRIRSGVRGGTPPRTPREQDGSHAGGTRRHRPGQGPAGRGHDDPGPGSRAR